MNLQKSCDQNKPRWRPPQGPRVGLGGGLCPGPSQGLTLLLLKSFVMKTTRLFPLSPWHELWNRQKIIQESIPRATTMSGTTPSLGRGLYGSSQWGEDPHRRWPLLAHPPALEAVPAPTWMSLGMASPASYQIPCPEGPSVHSPVPWA